MHRRMEWRYQPGTVLTGDDSDELENEILFNGPNKDHDFNESVVIQNVTAIDYSQKMVTTKS